MQENENLDLVNTVTDATISAAIALKEEVDTTKEKLEEAKKEVDSLKETAGAVHEELTSIQQEKEQLTTSIKESIEKVEMHKAFCEKATSGLSKSVVEAEDAIKNKTADCTQTLTDLNEQLQALLKTSTECVEKLDITNESEKINNLVDGLMDKIKESVTSIVDTEKEKVDSLIQAFHKEYEERKSMLETLNEDRKAMREEYQKEVEDAFSQLKKDAEKRMELLGHLEGKMNEGLNSAFKSLNENINLYRKGYDDFIRKEHEKVERKIEDMVNHHYQHLRYTNTDKIKLNLRTMLEVPIIGGTIINALILAILLARTI